MIVLAYKPRCYGIQIEYGTNWQWCEATSVVLQNASIWKLFPLCRNSGRGSESAPKQAAAGGQTGTISMVLETQNSQLEPPVNGMSTRKAERRSRQRAALQWVVHVSRAGGKQLVASKTRNVSSQGFYCLVQEPFESGERLECTVVIPIPKSTKQDDVLWLRCQARVLRVEPVPANTAYGIAC